MLKLNSDYGEPIVAEKAINNLVDCIQIDQQQAHQIMHEEPRAIYHSYSTYMSKRGYIERYSLPTPPILSIQDIIDLVDKLTEWDSIVSTQELVRVVLPGCIWALIKNQLMLRIIGSHQNFEFVRSTEKDRPNRYGAVDVAEQEDINQYFAGIGEAAGKYSITWWHIVTKELNERTNPHRHKGHVTFKKNLNEMLHEGFISPDPLDQYAIIFLDLAGSDLEEIHQNYI